MVRFPRFLSDAKLTSSEVQSLLNISADRLSALEAGSASLTPREIQILKGLTLRATNKETSEETDIAARFQKPGIESPSSWSVTNSTIQSHMIRVARSVRKPVRKSAQGLTALELCAGGGGTALGLEQANFIPVALFDSDKHACATLRKNRPYWNVIQADIRRFESDYWRNVDLLSGGLPCPPFSIAGKQLGAADERNLFPAMLKIVKVVRPRAILIENVRGILTSRFNDFRAGIDAQLRAEGFDTYWAGFNASEFGVPQTRFRAFLVALRRGETKPLEWPIAVSKKVETVGEALLDLMAERGWRGAAAWAKKANGPAPTIVGGSHKHGGPDLGPTRARREWAELGVDGLGLADEPPGPRFSGMPRLTVPMVARLQTFPDDWEFVGSKTHAHRQVGNALPVRLAYHVAQALRECLV